MNEEVNPYSIPNTGRSATRRKRGGPVKAVFLGVLVDIGGSLIVGIVLLIIAVLILVFQGIPLEQVEKYLFATDSWFLISAYIVGYFFSFLGGYTCARVARRSEYKLAGIVAFISAVASFWDGLGQYTLKTNTLLSLLAVLCVMLGAGLGVRNKKTS